MSAQIDPKIVGGEHDGYTLRFTRISAKPFKRGGVTVSQVGDYLRAVGRTGKISGDPQDIADAIEQTVNLTYKADLDWRVWDKSGFSLEGMNRFPPDGNGGFLPYVAHPTEVDPTTGKAQMLRANLTVKRFVAATNG